MIENIVQGSFRDPSGYVYSLDGVIHRVINKSYKENYDYLFNSGLYEILTKKDYLVKHHEKNNSSYIDNEYYKIISPTNIPFISYPYEWSFSQLKDAALLTLKVQMLALKHNMTLKDASAYNIQFKENKPIFIDTLSFERLPEGEPWQAYQQFCQHFLAPLLLMSKKDIRLSQLLKIYIDGIPLDLTSQLLPIKTYLSFGILSHLHLHSKLQTHYSNNQQPIRKIKKIKKINKIDITNICESLKNLINNLNWKPHGTEWINYYTSNNNYEIDTMEFKKNFVSNIIKKLSPNLVWDLGANTGYFSRLSSKLGFRTISFDIDPACVEINYLEMRDKNEINLLPLYLDLTNPSPAIGWGNTERSSIYQRNKPNLIMALALIHHLVISNNIPLKKIAELFSSLSPYLIIEFVSQDDTMVKKLLLSKKNVFEDYNKNNFEKIFGKYYKIISSKKILNSERIIYFMERIEKS